MVFLLSLSHHPSIRQPNLFWTLRPAHLGVNLWTQPNLPTEQHVERRQKNSSWKPAQEARPRRGQLTTKASYRKELTASHGILPTSDQDQDRSGRSPVRMESVPLYEAGGSYDRGAEVPSPKTIQSFWCHMELLFNQVPRWKSIISGELGARQLLRKKLWYNVLKELKQIALHFFMRQNETWKWERLLCERAWERKSPRDVSGQNCVARIFK